CVAPRIGCREGGAGRFRGRGARRAGSSQPRKIALDEAAFPDVLCENRDISIRLMLRSTAALAAMRLEARGGEPGAFRKSIPGGAQLSGEITIDERRPRPTDRESR